MPEIQVQIYRQGSQWVAKASNLNIAFVAGSREEVGSAVRAALRRCVGEAAEVDVVEVRHRSVSPARGRPARPRGPEPKPQNP